MSVKATLYIDVTSSWCYWAQPAWDELKQTYNGLVDFEWKIALMDASGLPVSREQEAWFYRRSGTIVRSPFMLNTDWYEPGQPEYLVPNLVAEAARDFGVTDDRVRLAIAEAALRGGEKIGGWGVSIDVAAQAANLDATALLTRAQSPEVEARARASTAEFHSFQVDQRPAFLVEDSIGDRAIFSGLVATAPLAATIDAMLNDVAAYESYAAHFGDPPKS